MQAKQIKVILNLILLCFIISSCKTDPKNFRLKGKVQNMVDSTTIYLEGYNILDSAIITNNHFEFATKLDSTPMKLTLFTKGYSQYRFFWAVDSLMTFDAKASDFRNADISGSYIEDTSEELTDKKKIILQENADLDIAEQNLLALETDFIDTNPDHFLAVYYLNFYSKTFGKQKTQGLYNNLNINLKKSLLGNKISNYLNLATEADIGDVYTDFAMPDINNDKQKFSELMGRLTLLEFWASWCAPCRKENPNLVKTYNKYKSKGFEIVAISTDGNQDRWKKAIENDKLTWIHLNDLKVEDNLAKTIYSVYEIPANFLIDSTGTIIAKNLRGQELNNVLDSLLIK